jgi:hypothetical protein
MNTMIWVLAALLFAWLIYDGQAALEKHVANKHRED